MVSYKKMILSLLLLFFANLGFGDDWLIKKEENGMRASCKYHKTGYEYCKIEATFDNTLKELIAINTDPEYLSVWMALLSSTMMLHKYSDTDYVIYSQYEIPAPFHDRDSCTRSNIKQDPNSKTVRLEFKTTDECVELKPGIQRMESVVGYWQFSPKSKIQTNVEFVCLMLPGGNLIPEFYNMKTLENPWMTVINMKAELQTSKYKNPKIDFIENY